MKKFLTLIACGLFLAVPPTFAAGKLQALVYPTKAHPSFLIDIPGDWKLTPAEEEGDYFHLDGPTGAIFSFRTLEGSENALTDSMKHCLTRMNEKFKAVEIGDAQDWKPDGLTGFYAVGTAKAKSALRSASRSHGAPCQTTRLPSFGSSPISTTRQAWTRPTRSSIR